MRISCEALPEGGVVVGGVPAVVVVVAGAVVVVFAVVGGDVGYGGGSLNTNVSPRSGASPEMGLSDGSTSRVPRDCSGRLVQPAATTPKATAATNQRTSSAARKACERGKPEFRMNMTQLRRVAYLARPALSVGIVPFGGGLEHSEHYLMESKCQTPVALSNQ